MGSPGERVLGIDSSHSDICRFSGGPHDSGKFQPVKEHLIRLSTKAKEKVMAGHADPQAGDNVIGDQTGAGP